MSSPSAATFTTVNEDGCGDGGATISTVHSDVIQTHILNRLDGPTLASAGCASSQLHALCAEENLWRDICVATWPSLEEPLVRHIISTIPGGYRSVFSNSFPLLDHRSFHAKNPDPSSLTSELISAVDMFYKDKLIFSKIQKMETESAWFLCSPFRVDLLDPKDSVPTPVQHAGHNEAWMKNIEDNLTLSWILIDPTRKHTANLSSLRPVSVQRHWLTGDVAVRYAIILARDQRFSELVECAIKVTFGGEEGGEMQVRKVSMMVEDMEGRNINGEETLVILQGAMQSGKRKKAKNDGDEEKKRFNEYLEIKKERKEKKERIEKALDFICIATGVTIFVAFWSFILFR
ncbi:putative F-box family protein [Quillaja saponaria]|uniref:F-box family protein n=1 Tax=Quillaja saponaria TaxID=32244 RepID=A0AAD7PAT2_QUISA|nr:putative F-box family protein [Quillaja saponaria]